MLKLSFYVHHQKDVRHQSDFKRARSSTNFSIHHIKKQDLSQFRPIPTLKVSPSKKRLEFLTSDATAPSEKSRQIYL